MANKSPQQQLFVPVPKANMRQMGKRNVPSLEFETNAVLIEAEEALAKPRDRCNVGHAGMKASFRRD